MEKTIPLLFNILKNYKHHLMTNLSGNLSAQHIKILKIIRQNKQMTASGLAQVIGCHKAHITRMLKVLDENKLIKKSPHPSDKRQEIIKLSGESTKILKKVDRLEEKFETSIFSKLTSSEVKSFKEILTKISQ